MALITLLDAQLAFGHVPLLDHADFSLETQERVGLIGRSNSFKISLFKCAAFVFLLTILISNAFAQSLPKGRCDRPAQKVDLRHCDFSQRGTPNDQWQPDLGGSDLRGVSFRGAYLGYGAVFDKALIEGADFSGARMGNVSLRGTEDAQIIGIAPDVWNLRASEFEVLETKGSGLTLRRSRQLPMTRSLNGGFSQEVERHIAGVARPFAISRSSDKRRLIALMNYPKYPDWEGESPFLIAVFNAENLIAPACVVKFDAGRHAEYGRVFSHHFVEVGDGSIRFLALSSGGDGGFQWSAFESGTLTADCIYKPARKISTGSQEQSFCESGMGSEFREVIPVSASRLTLIKKTETWDARGNMRASQQKDQLIWDESKSLWLDARSGKPYQAPEICVEKK